MFTAGLWLSAVVFAMYALVPSYAATLACRVAQGVSGGLIYGTASALVTQSLPRERYGRGLGVMSLGLGVGVAVGPVIGGLLVDAFGWRAVFLYRAPLALALGVVATRFLGRSLRGAAGEMRRLALVDIARLAVLRPAVLAFLATFAQFSVWLLIPFYLVSARGIGASLGGVLFTLSPLGTALAAPLAGWAADRLGTRWPIVIGLGMEMLGLVVIRRLAPDSPLVAVVAGLLLVGFGVGVFQVPNLTQIMAAFPRAQQGAAGGLAFLGRAFGSAVGVQVTAALFDARRAAGAGFMSAFESPSSVRARGGARRPDRDRPCTCQRPRPGSRYDGSRHGRARPRRRYRNRREGAGPASRRPRRGHHRHPRHSKPNARVLLERVAEGLRERFGAREVRTWRKPTSSSGATPGVLDEIAATCTSPSPPRPTEGRARRGVSTTRRSWKGEASPPSCSAPTSSARSPPSSRARTACLISPW